MNKIILAIILLIFTFSLKAANCGKKSDNFCQVKVVDVYDGDTFYVDVPKLPTLFGKRLGIRVYGVDTPEIRGGSAYEKVMAKEAKKYTKAALDGAKRVDLTECVRGKYFRIVCKVLIDGTSLSKALITNKLAVPYMERK